MTNYNLTGLKNANNPVELVQVVNSATNGLLVGGFIFAFFIVLTMMFKKYNFDKAITISSFLSFSISLLAMGAGLINFYIVLIFLALMAFSIFYEFLIKQ